VCIITSPEPCLPRILPVCLMSGTLAGLVAITAEPLAPSPLMATIVGAVGGLIVVIAIICIDKAKIDDPVGAISVHGVVVYGGFWRWHLLIQKGPFLPS
jgi:ammonia channel protein AmtB